jgi:hypothetical protein
MQETSQAFVDLDRSAIECFNNKTRQTAIFEAIDKLNGLLRFDISGT